jgi:colanic acid biosynthesis glycosyl transferase WcaI
VTKVTLVAPNYPPESGAAANRVAGLAERLAERGWSVTVVTLLPHYPQNRVYPSFAEPSARDRTENGVRILRFRPWIVPRDSLLLRLLSELAFCVQAFVALLRQPTRLVVASSPYMFLGQVGLAAARLRRTPFAWDVRDLTWLYPRATRKRTFGLDRPIEAIMCWTAARADLVTTATEGLKTYFGSRPRACEVVPNGVSDAWLDRLNDLPPPNPTNPGTVVYAGLFGYNHGLGTVVDAAFALPDVPFVLVGDGPEREMLEAKVAELGLTNVTFAGYLDPDGLLEVYRDAAILVSHVRANPLFAWTQPAKVWEYMATGRPVVHAGEGEAVEILDRHRLGRTVPPDDAEELASAVRALLNDPDEARLLGERGRAFVTTNRRRSRLLDAHEDALRALVRDC